MLHTLILLAWNLTNQENFEAASKACAQELFSNVVAHEVRVFQVFNVGPNNFRVL